MRKTWGVLGLGEHLGPDATLQTGERETGLERVRRNLL